MSRVLGVNFDETNERSVRGPTNSWYGVVFQFRDRLERVVHAMARDDLGAHLAHAHDSSCNESTRTVVASSSQA